MESRRSIDQEFDFRCMTELGRIYLLIQKYNGAHSDQKDSSNFLICPNVTCVEYKNITESKLGVVDVKYLDFRYINPIYSFIRLHTADGRHYVAKVLGLKEWDTAESISALFLFLNELNLHKKHGDIALKCPNLVSMEDMLVEYDSNAPAKNPIFYMIYEDFHCTLRDLIEFRRKSKQSFSILEVIRILCDVAKGLKAMHSVEIAHRNLRPETIVFNSDKNLFMISSLALASQVEASYTAMPCLLGTPFYMAVDVFSDYRLEKKKVHFVVDQLKSDVYALGVIAVELMAGVLSGRNFGYYRRLYSFVRSKKLQDITDLIKFAEEKLSLHALLLEVVE